MKYISTRGGITPVTFSDAVMMGLANDGGLLLPEQIPDARTRLGEWRQLTYPELSYEILSLFNGGDIAATDLKTIIDQSFTRFTHPEITPVVSVDSFHLLELFHGPTLAFKDLALQFLGSLFEYLLDRHHCTLNILGATSGDTGSAAIHAIRGKRHMNIFILYPYKRISPTQELQMTTVLDDNVFNIAIDGSFDDGQKIIKEIFNDLKFKERFAIGAVNSVNWARVAAQIVYYFYGAFRTTEKSACDQISVCVPTGNFGNIFAGYLAVRMGAPIKSLILATNRNDILARFFNSGMYRLGETRQTCSPSMDIQVASNFERYLYYLVGGDSNQVRELMAEFSANGCIDLRNMKDETANVTITAGSCSNDDTAATIRTVYEQCGYILDPHTAVGVKVALNSAPNDVPILCLATAHPAKFDDAVTRSLGCDRVRHESIESLQNLPTRCVRLPASTAAIALFMEQALTRQHGESTPNPTHI